MIKYEINQGYRCCIEATNKFKSVLMEVKFYYPLDQLSVSKSVLLANLLGEQSAIHPDKMAMSAYQDYLYGAMCGIRNELIGNYGRFSISTKVVNANFTALPLQQLQQELLHELIFEPLLENGDFIPSLFEEARRNALGGWLRYHVFALEPNGDKTQLEQLTSQEVIDWWQHLVSKCYVELIVIGDVEPATIKAQVQDWFNPGTAMVDGVTYHLPLPGFQQVSESGPIKQTQLVMTYHSPVNYADPDYYQLMVGCALFGQLPNSLLFEQVREQRSLCYSINSRLHAYEGGLAVMTGIDVKNVEAVKVLVEELKTQVVEAKYEMELLDSAKELIISNLLSSYDTTEGMLNDLHKQLHIDKRLTKEQVIKEIMDVTTAMIAKQFSQLVLTTVYTYQQEQV